MLLLLIQLELRLFVTHYMFCFLRKIRTKNNNFKLFMEVKLTAISKKTTYAYNFFFFRET